MADVFISYARSNEAEASAVGDALRSEGYAVWRDDELPAHRTYGEVIEERLGSAKAVVVLWSADAARSQWVRAEADSARNAGTLVQATLDGTIPPLPFNQIQCADLDGWAGDTSSAGWRKLLASVSALAGKPQPVAGEQRRPKRKTSVCVLPFANMSGDPEQEYFSDGISEDITTDLSKISALEVIARNTAFTFKGQSIDVCDIARKLAVSHILEGSVRKAGGRVRITAQLIDGRTGGHLWAERYDRDLTDIFAIQDEISKAIVDALRVKLLPSEKKAIQDRGTTNADAYNLYLMARQEWVGGNHGDPRREEGVARICRRALEIDPDYARAWALLAMAQSQLRYGYGRPGDDGTEAAQKALSIDPTLPDAHCALVRRLIEDRRYADAEAELSEALKFSPDSWELNKEAARLHCRQKNLEESAYFFGRCAALDETDFYDRVMLITYLNALGRHDEMKEAASEALERATAVLDDDPGNRSALSLGARALAALGEFERSNEWMERAMLLDPDNLNMRYNFGAMIAAHRDDPVAALELLGSALSRAGGTLIGWARVDPDVDSLRAHPRFEAMVSEAERRTGRARPSLSSTEAPA
jgi:adenylate cyclase